MNWIFRLFDEPPTTKGVGNGNCKCKATRPGLHEDLVGVLPGSITPWVIIYQCRASLIARAAGDRVLPANLTNPTVVRVRPDENEGAVVSLNCKDH